VGVVTGSAHRRKPIEVLFQTARVNEVVLAGDFPVTRKRVSE